MTSELICLAPNTRRILTGAMLRQIFNSWTTLLLQSTPFETWMLLDPPIGTDKFQTEMSSLNSVICWRFQGSKKPYRRLGPR